MNQQNQYNYDRCPCGYKKKTNFIDKVIVFGIICFTIYYVFFKGKKGKIGNILENSR